MLPFPAAGTRPAPLFFRRAISLQSVLSFVIEICRLRQIIVCPELCLKICPVPDCCLFHDVNSARLSYVPLMVAKRRGFFNTIFVTSAVSEVIPESNTLLQATKYQIAVLQSCGLFDLHGSLQVSMQAWRPDFLPAE